MLDLTLFQIEDGLRDLYAMRQELWEETAATLTRADEIDAELKTIDQAIRDYIGAEIKKTDGVADFILMLDRLCHEQRERKGSVERCQIDQEIDRLKARRDSLRGVLAHVKDAVKFVMEGMSWREGKPKKLEGVRHSITLRGNGGAAPVEITNESLIPPELCRVTVTMSEQLWLDVRALTSQYPDFWLDVFNRSKVVREVSRSAIAEALAKTCEQCSGQGRVCADCTSTVNCGRTLAEAQTKTCEACGGTGTAGVPGCRLAERGSSVVVK